MLKVIKDYLFVSIGAFLLAFGTSFFLVPCKISTGGVGGVGMILFHVFKFPISVTTLMMNMILLAIGYKLLGGSSILKTIVGIVLYSLFLEVCESFGCYSEDILIAAVFGGILVGVGVGLAVFKNASTGGSDLVAVILHKLIPYISVADFILLMDSCVIIASGIVFKNYTIMFYSVISLYLSSKITDYLLVRGDRAKCVYIISEKNAEISNMIMKDLERGVTGIYSKGMYSNKDTTMLMCIVKSKEALEIVRKIKRIDKNSFTIITEVREVIGEGFKPE